MVAITAWITALVAAVLGSAVPLYNVELGTKSLFYYRAAYATKTNLMYYMSPIFATLVTSIAITTILTWRETQKTKSKIKSEDSRNVALRRNNGKIEQTAARSISTIVLTFFTYFVGKISALCFIKIATRIRTSNQLQSQWLFFVANCLIFGSGSCNAFIYTCRSSRFRLALKKSWKSFCKGERFAPFNHNPQRKQEGCAKAKLMTRPSGSGIHDSNDFLYWHKVCEDDMY